MKKILAYSLVAVLLGVVTMLAPFALFISEMDTQAERLYPLTPRSTQTMSSETERTYGITPATYPPDILAIAFMLTLSLIVALGVMRFMRRTIF